MTHVRATRLLVAMGRVCPFKMMDNNYRLADALPASCLQLREALRSAASALKEHGTRFALAGSYPRKTGCSRAGPAK
jgi:hypothetical protein